VLLGAVAGTNGGRRELEAGERLRDEGGVIRGVSIDNLEGAVI
jgi:hypothetical protein